MAQLNNEGDITGMYALQIVQRPHLGQGEALEGHTEEGEAGGPGN